MSNRVLMSMLDSDTFFWETSLKEIVNSNWPFGYFFIQKLIIEFFRLFGLADTAIIKCIILFSIGLYLSISALGMRLLKDDTKKYSFGLLLLCYPTLLFMSASVYSELYALFFVVLSLLFFNKAKWTGLLLSSILLLVSTTIRTELISIILGLALYLIYHRKVLQSIVFTGISSSFFVFRYFYAYFIIPENESFLTHNIRTHDLHGFEQLTIMITDFLMPSGLLFLGLVVLVLLKGSRLRFTERSKFFLFAFSGFILLVYAILNEQSRGSERFFLIPGFLLLASLLASIPSSSVELLKRYSLSTIPLTSVFLLSYIFYPIPSIALGHKPQPEAISKTINWLKKNNAHEHYLFIDNLNGWDQHIQLYYHESIKRPVKSFSFAYFPKLTDTVAVGDYDKLSEQFIITYKPKWLIISSGSLSYKLSNKEFTELFLESSFLKNSIYQKSDSLILSIENQPEYLLNPVFETSDTKIVEVLYDE